MACQAGYFNCPMAKCCLPSTLSSGQYRFRFRLPGAKNKTMVYTRKQHWSFIPSNHVENPGA